MRALFILLLSATVAGAETIGEVYVDQAAHIYLDNKVCHKPLQYYELMNLMDKIAAEYGGDRTKALDLVSVRSAALQTADYCAGRV